MTNKRKKLARDISKKTGVSHAGAINILNQRAIAALYGPLSKCNDCDVPLGHSHCHECNVPLTDSNRAFGGSPGLRDPGAAFCQNCWVAVTNLDPKHIPHCMTMYVSPSSGDYHLSDSSGTITLRQVFDVARADPGAHLFFNYKVFCDDPAIAQRIHIYEGIPPVTLDVKRGIHRAERAGLYAIERLPRAPSDPQPQPIRLSLEVTEDANGKFKGVCFWQPAKGTDPLCTTIFGETSKYTLREHLLDLIQKEFDDCCLIKETLGVWPGPGIDMLHWVKKTDGSWESFIDVAGRRPLSRKAWVANQFRFPPLITGSCAKHNLEVVGLKDRPEDEQELREQLSLAEADPDYNLFVNYPVICDDPGLKARIHVFPGATAAEISEQQDLFARGIRYTWFRSPCSYNVVDPLLREAETRGIPASIWFTKWSKATGGHECFADFRMFSREHLQIESRLEALKKGLQGTYQGLELWVTQKPSFWQRVVVKDASGEILAAMRPLED